MKSASSITLLILLVFAIGINYIDRGSLSVVKTDVATEFELTNTQLGLLFSAFFWSYALSQIFAGWLVDRTDVKWIYAGGFLIWSLATVSMALSSSFAVFLLLRLLLGLGESVAFPASSKLIVLNFEEHRRGLANALLDAASKLGPTLALLLGGLLVANSGWRVLFLVVGLGGMVWLPAWLWLVPSQKKDATQHAAARTTVPVTALMRRQEFWGTCLGFFCLGYTWAFLLSWLPAYLEESRNFSKESMAIFGSLPFLAMAITSILGGWLSDRLIRGGASPTRVRKSFMLGGLMLCALPMFGAVLATDHRVCIALLCLACASLGFYTSNVWAITQTMAGPYAAGQWTGLQNAIGNIGSAISPALTGWLVQETGSYYSAFAAASVVLVGAVFCYVVMVRQIVPLDWQQPSHELQGATQMDNTSAAKQLSRRQIIQAAAVAAVASSKPIWANEPPKTGWIDAHVHIWTPDTLSYPIADGFTKSDMRPASFTPDELFAECRPVGVDRIVLIQMSFYKFDNRYMLDAIAKYPDTFRGVGIIDHEQASAAATMKALQKQGVTGFRLYANAESAKSWINSPEMAVMWKTAGDTGQAICLLANPDALPAIESLCRKFPRTRVVVDHFARIGVDGKMRSQDLNNLCKLADLPEVYIKTSAFYALGEKKPPYVDLAPMIRQLHERFGAQRLMWASDCPYQVQDAHTYAASIELIRDRLDFLTEEDKSWILQKTAQKVYWSAS